MKNFSFAIILIVLISSIILVGCMELITGLTPPAPNNPDVSHMTVTLSWSAVDKAINYILSINLESEGVTNRDITFPVEKVVNGTSYNWSAPGPGEYSWKIRARNDKGESRWVSGENFTIQVGFDTPVVNIIYPTEGQTVNTLTPTIQWIAEPGTLTHAIPRDYAIDDCEVIITENDEQIHTGSGVQDTDNTWSYQIPNGLLEYGKTYEVKVNANQEGAFEAGEDTKTFKAPTGIGLELSESSMYNCGIITATVTAFEPDIDKVALFGKLKTQQDYIQIAPPTGWRELDMNRQAVFTLETNELGVGNWLINAQSWGSSSKSVEKSLEIKEIALMPELELKICDISVENDDYVYVHPNTGLPAVAVYTVDVNLDEKLDGIISEFYYIFEFAGAESYINTSSTYSFDTWSATDILISMPTECTKHATVTLFGTSVCNEHVDTFVFEPVTLSFTLDAALPEITFAPHEFGPEKGTLRIPVQLTDTKSLCQATMSFVVEKLDSLGNQMIGWESVEIPWGVETVEIGSGENKIGGTITYSDPIIFGETTTVDATVLLALGKLDGATLTSTVTAIDCCGDCINTCSVEAARKPSAKSVEIFFDNTFYRKRFVNISFFDIDDFEDLGDSWLITGDNNPSQASFCFADAYIDDVDDVEITITGDIGAIIPSGTSSFATNIIAECTGYPFKNEICVLLSLTAVDGKETTVDAELIATDQNGNTTELTQLIKIDTQSPILASADGHLGQSEGNSSDDYVEFVFRLADLGQHPTFAGATVTVDGNENKRQWYSFLGSVYEYGEQRGIVRLNEDNQFRVNFDASSYGLNEGGTVSIEINASDKYSNTGYTSVIGNVSNSGSQR